MSDVPGAPMTTLKHALVTSLVLACLLVSSVGEAKEPQKLVHVSFGFTKAFYAEYNRWFAEKWQRETGNEVVVEQSHGPSGTQTEAVIQGKLAPDVLSLASPSDIDVIAKKTQLLAPEWRTSFPNASSPYSSAVVFLVRPGNPKQIRDWNDLALPDRELVTSDPKACGGGRWNYVAAFGLGAGFGGNSAKKQDYLAAFLKNVPTVYANQGEAGEAFLKSGAGDVLLTYESFALGVSQKPDAVVELVAPPKTVEIALPVAIARKNTEKNKTTEVARAYLNGLYHPDAQALLAKHYFRPRNKSVAAKNAGRFPAIQLVPAQQLFGESAERQHLTEGGTFDTLRTPAASSSK